MESGTPPPTGSSRRSASARRTSRTLSWRRRSASICGRVASRERKDQEAAGRLDLLGNAHGCGLHARRNSRRNCRNDFCPLSARGGCSFQFGRTSALTERAPLRPLPLKHEKILPRQECVGLDQRIPSGGEFRGDFFGRKAEFGRWPFRCVKFEIYYRDPSVRYQRIPQFGKVGNAVVDVVISIHDENDVDQLRNVRTICSSSHWHKHA